MHTWYIWRTLNLGQKHQNTTSVHTYILFWMMSFIGSCTMMTFIEYDISNKSRINYLSNFFFYFLVKYWFDSDRVRVLLLLLLPLGPMAFAEEENNEISIYNLFFMFFINFRIILQLDMGYIFVLAPNTS